MRGLICLLLLLNTVISVPAQTLGRYATQLLQRIAEHTGISSQLDTLHQDGFYPNFRIYKGRPVTVIIRANRVEHIGFSLFSLSQREAMPSPAYNFIERYSLELRLPQNDPISTERRMELDKVVFTRGNIEQLATLYGDTTLNFRLTNHDERLYDMEWLHGDSSICRIVFPSNYELLHGSKLIENEGRLRHEIEQFCDTILPKTIYSIDKVQKNDSLGYYVLNIGFNRVPQIANKRYLRLKTDSVTKHDYLLLINNPAYPVESVVNLLSTLEIPNDIFADVQLQKYNFQQDCFRVRLHQLVGFCLAEGCKPYFGLLDYNEHEGKVDAVVMMRNHEEAYEHLLRITVETKILSKMSGSISVKLMPYIMTHNSKRI